MRAHDPRNRIDIGNGDRRIAEQSRPLHIFFGMRGSGEEGEIGCYREFREHIPLYVHYLFYF